MLEKTEAGRAALGQRAGTLCRRSRALLIMVDGRTSVQDMVSRAGQLGLDASAVTQLLEDGLIKVAAGHMDATHRKPAGDAQLDSPAPADATRKRSLAAARMYLMDVMARTFGTADHPIRARLVEATDRAAVEAAFEEFLVVLGDMASPSLVAHIEGAFRELLPLG
ncbi:hypothetical protein [Cupriavidus basilensis]|uniref:hypothetical protein n=1 Tax=Cupriavidus basilensis TaxID=68895 RepID=UPI0023E7F0FD|nr:hypothetical protein [Cupriavidus basilensis]